MILRVLILAFLSNFKSNLLEFETFGPPYTSSRKEPDHCVRLQEMDRPTLVIEYGWRESRPQRTVTEICDFLMAKALSR